MPVKAIISLKNLVDNAKTIKRKLPEKVKFCAVVKADGYGHGAEKVAGALYPFVDCFAVATASEGVALRLSGVDKDILVLTKTFPYDAERAVFYRLTLTVSDKNDITVYERAAKRLNIAVKVHVKFDTGMNRQGVSTVQELTEILDRIKISKRVIFEGLYSHFSMPENDISRKKAIRKFLVAKNIAKVYNNNAICHISASGGFIKGEYFDMVRIGILLYGYKPFETDKISVKRVMKVYAPVVARKTVFCGDGVLYGDKRVKCDTPVTLVRYGYADGLFRKEIAGQVNDRCMDISAIKGICHKNYCPVMTDAKKLADIYGTIPYEILVKCALRAEKIYK